MRNKQNTGHPVRFLIRRNLFLAMIVFVVMFASVTMFFISNGRVLSDDFAIQLAQNTDPDLNAGWTRTAGVFVRDLFFWRRPAELMAFLFAGIGVLSALVLNMHRFDRRNAIMQASLPVKRDRDFLHRLTAFAALVLLPSALCMALSAGIFSTLSFAPYTDASLLYKRFAAMLLMIVYGYAAGTLASVLTGRFWAVCLGVCVLAFTPEILFLIFRSWAFNYLDTLSYVSEGHLLVSWSPCFGLYKWMVLPETFTALPGILVTLLFLAAAFGLTLIRPAEAAGHTLAFPVTDPILTVVLCVLGGTVTGGVYTGLFNTEAALLGGMAAGALLAGVACHLLFTLHIRGLVRKLWAPAVAFVLLLTGTACLRWDVFGHDRYIPGPDDIQSVTINVIVGNSYHDYTLTDPSSVDAVRAYVSTLCDSASAQPKGYYDRTVPSPVTVTWKTPGGAVTRVYRRHSSEESRALVRSVVESPGFRAAMTDNRLSGLLRELSEHSRIYLDFSPSFDLRTDEARNGEDPMFDIPQLYLNLKDYDRTRFNALADAIDHDLEKRGFRDLRSVPVGNLSFTGSIAGDSWTAAELAVYSCDTEILRVLYGENAEEVTAYLRGGFMNDANTVAIRVGFPGEKPEWQDSSVYWSTAGCVLSPYGGTAEKRANFMSDHSNTSIAYTWLGFEPEKPEYILLVSAQRLEESFSEAGITLPDPLPRTEAEWVALLNEYNGSVEIHHVGSFFALPDLH